MYLYWRKTLSGLEYFKKNCFNPHVGIFFHCFERDSKLEREKETSVAYLLIHAPTRDQTHRAGVCPD